MPRSGAGFAFFADVDADVDKGEIMAFELDLDEPVSDGVKRIVMEEVEYALSGLRLHFLPVRSIPVDTQKRPQAETLRESLVCLIRQD